MTKEGRLFIVTQRFQSIPNTTEDLDPTTADGLMDLVGAFCIVGFITSLITGCLNYYFHGYHNHWALDLLRIATPIAFYTPWLTYTLLKWSVTWKWMPFDQKTIIWTKFPLNFWFITSVLWTVPCITSLVLFIVAQSLLHMWCGLVISLDGKDGVLRELVVNLYKVISWAVYSLGIGFIYPNGSAMSRINKEWTKYYPDSPSSTNQLGPGPGPSSPPAAEKSSTPVEDPSTLFAYPCYTDLPCIKCDSWDNEKGRCSINRVKAWINDA